MAKVKVVSIGAIIDGRPIGSTFELDERTANRLAALQYVKIIDRVSPVNKESAPKKPAETKSSKPKIKPKSKAKAKE